ncbi:hypothetical protein C4M95_01850, partial [Mycoplasmopsis pullorum]
RIETLERENSRLQNSISSLTRERDDALNDAEYWRNRVTNPSGDDSSAEELKKAKARLIELTGVDDPDYDLGTDGAEAKAGSYIYNLNAKIEQLTNERDNYRTLYQGKVKDYETLIAAQNSMKKYSIGRLSFRSHSPYIFYRAGTEIKGRTWEEFQKNKRKVDIHDATRIDLNFLASDKYQDSNFWTTSDIELAYTSNSKLPSYFNVWEIQKWDFILSNSHVTMSTIMSKILVSTSTFEFDTDINDLTELKCNFENGVSTLSLSSLKNKISEYNQYGTRDFKKKYLMKQFTFFDGAVAYQKKGVFVFRENFIEITYSPSISITKEKNKLIFNFYLAPTYANVWAGADWTTSYPYTYEKRKDGSEEFYWSDEVFKKATNADLNSNSYSELEKERGTVYLYDEISLPVVKTPRDYIPYSMYIELK